MLKLGIEGNCLHCGNPCDLRDSYLVRDSVWANAVRPGWKSGFLHLACLEERLGREVETSEFIIAPGGLIHKENTQTLLEIWVKNGVVPESEKTDWLTLFSLFARKAAPPKAKKEW
jgi:hypothetical protein